MRHDSVQLNLLLCEKRLQTVSHMPDADLQMGFCHLLAGVQLKQEQGSEGKGTAAAS